jgi:hypothetical protein
VELVVLEPVGRQRPEGVEPDVEGHALDVELLQQLRREVEPCGGRRRRARVARVDGLVALGLVEALGDVGRERHLAVRLSVQAQPPAPLAERLEQLHRPETLAGLEPPRGARETFPDVHLETLDQEHLCLSPGLPPQPQPGRDDPRVVHHDELAGQLLRKLEEPAMPDLPGRAVVDEQPRFVPPFGRVLCNQLCR